MPLTGTLHQEVLQWGMGRLLSTQIVASPVSNVNFTLPGPQSKYDIYLFDITRIRSNPSGAFGFRQSTDGGASFDIASNYWWSQIYSYSHGGPPRGGSLSAGLLGGNYLTYCYLIGEPQPSVDSNVELFIHGIGGAQASVKAQSSGWETYGNVQRITGCQLVSGINAVTFFCWGSNITGGEFKLYGIKKGVA